MDTIRIFQNRGACNIRQFVVCHSLTYTLLQIEYFRRICAGFVVCSFIYRRIRAYILIISIVKSSNLKASYILFYYIVHKFNEFVYDILAHKIIAALSKLNPQLVSSLTIYSEFWDTVVTFIQSLACSLSSICFIALSKSDSIGCVLLNIAYSIYAFSNAYL